jgi:hypothetical protein
VWSDGGTNKATKQSRASIPWILLARPPQPYGAENSYEKVQNVVTDCMANNFNDSTSSSRWLSHIVLLIDFPK